MQFAQARFLELQLWRTGGRVNSGAVRSEKQPSANAQRRVENRKREQKMRKNSRDGQGTSTKGTSTTLSNTLAETIRLPPDKPPNK